MGVKMFVLSTRNLISPSPLPP